MIIHLIEFQNKAKTCETSSYPGQTRCSPPALQYWGALGLKGLKCHTLQAPNGNFVTC